MPSGASASAMAFMIGAVPMIVPDSPTPFVPSGFSGEGAVHLGNRQRRHLRGARQRVVHERAGGERAVGLVDHLLEHGLAEALRRAAPDLALDEQRVHHRAAIVDGDQALDVDVARVGVDAHHGERRAEAEGFARRLEEGRALQAERLAGGSLPRP